MFKEINNQVERMMVCDGDIVDYYVWVGGISEILIDLFLRNILFNYF